MRSLVLLGFILLFSGESYAGICFRVYSVLTGTPVSDRPSAPTDGYSYEVTVEPPAGVRGFVAKGIREAGRVQIDKDPALPDSSVANTMAKYSYGQLNLYVGKTSLFVVGGFTFLKLTYSKAEAIFNAEIIVEFDPRFMKATEVRAMIDAASKMATGESTIENWASIQQKKDSFVIKPRFLYRNSTDAMNTSFVLHNIFSRLQFPSPYVVPDEVIGRVSGSQP